ncbi:putative Ccc1 family protein [Helianthus debilis subsp. tardiflorus]
MATIQNALSISISENQSGSKQHQMSPGEDFDFSQRGQWLRAAVLGANDGLVSVASLMTGIGAVKEDAKAMILSGFAGLVAGACSMAIGEFVSVYTQLDIEVAQMKRENRMTENKEDKRERAAAQSYASSSRVGSSIFPRRDCSFTCCFLHRRP